MTNLPKRLIELTLKTNTTDDILVESVIKLKNDIIKSHTISEAGFTCIGYSDNSDEIFVELNRQISKFNNLLSNIITAEDYLNGTLNTAGVLAIVAAYHDMDDGKITELVTTLKQKNEPTFSKF